MRFETEESLANEIARILREERKFTIKGVGHIDGRIDIQFLIGGSMGGRDYEKFQEIVLKVEPKLDIALATVRRFNHQKKEVEGSMLLVAKGPVLEHQEQILRSVSPEKIVTTKVALSGEIPAGMVPTPMSGVGPAIR